MNNLDKNYLALCQEILDKGVSKKDRTGTGTISLFGKRIEHDMKEGFPLLTTKKMSLKNIATELRWFLNGDTNIQFLLERNCKIWTGDAYKRYFDAKMRGNENFWFLTKEEFETKIIFDDEFAKEWGELGPIYGKQWVNWETTKWDMLTTKDGRKTGHVKYRTNQIADLIKNLKDNPDSRRLMVNAWNVGEINDAVLPPCHYGFQIYTRLLSEADSVEFLSKSDQEEVQKIKEEKFSCVKNQDYVMAAALRGKEKNILDKIPRRAISLMWNQRSVDTALGLPYNIASYGLLLTMLANEVGMIPDKLIGNLGDTHLYSNHIEPIKEQINRLDPIVQQYDLPKLNIKGGIETPLDGTDFNLIGYESQPAINFLLSN